MAKKAASRNYGKGSKSPAKKAPAKKAGGGNKGKSLGGLAKARKSLDANLRKNLDKVGDDTPEGRRLHKQAQVYFNLGGDKGKSPTVRKAKRRKK